MNALWDISPPVHAGSPVFPGDARYEQRWAATLGPGCPVNVSTLTLSPHTGAHADAPLHYDAAGSSAGALALDAYLGPCRVIHAIECGALIEWHHLERRIDATLPPRGTWAASHSMWCVAAPVGIFMRSMPLPRNSFSA